MFPILMIYIIAVLVFILWAITAPRSALHFVENLWLAVIRPFVVVQNLIAQAIQSISERVNSLTGQVGGIVAVIGALVQLVVFGLLTVSGFFVTTTTIAGIFGQDVHFDLPSLEVLTGLSLIVGLAYLLAVGLELLGVGHFGQWDQLQGFARKFVGAITFGLALLGLVVMWQLGASRYELSQLTSAELDMAVGEQMSTDEGLVESQVTLQPLPSAARWVLIGLPIFVDLTAALAMWGALRVPLALSLAIIWLIRLLMTLLNLIPTIIVQVFDALQRTSLSIIHWLAQVGQWLGVQLSDLPESTAPLDSGDSHHNAANVHTVTVPNSPPSHDGGTSSPGDGSEYWFSNAPNPNHDELEPPTPQLEPIEEPDIDPLGVNTSRR